jgi:hypothetical protein
MNHLPYKEWLLSEDSLSSEQAKTLAEHLKTCQSCQQVESGWKDVEVLFQKTPAVTPVPGFASRWQARLEAHRLRKQRRLAWTIVGIFSGIAAILITLFGTQVLQMLDSPGNLILVWISRITGVLSIYWAIENLVNHLVMQLPSLTWLALIFGTGIVSFLFVLWLATFRKLTMARRLV